MLDVKMIDRAVSPNNTVFWSSTTAGVSSNPTDTRQPQVSPHLLSDGEDGGGEVVLADQRLEALDQGA
jgi:hypothetical protein